MKNHQNRLLAQWGFLLCVATASAAALAQVGAGGGLGAGSATPIKPGPTAPVVACPHPFSAPPMVASGDFVNAGDMPPDWPNHPHQGIGGTGLNTWKGYSFDIRRLKMPGPCCQVTSAVLTVTFKALQGGAAGSSTSANDGWNVMSHGKAVPVSPAVSGFTFGGGAVTTGQTVTKTVSITDLTVIEGGFVSIFSQDDTEIVSATLAVSGCCVNMK